MGNVVVEEFLLDVEVFFVAEDVLFQGFYGGLGEGLGLLLGIQALENVEKDLDVEAKFIYFVELGIDLIIKLILVDLLRILGLEVTENNAFFFFLFFGGFAISFYILFFYFVHLFFG